MHASGHLIFHDRKIPAQTFLDACHAKAAALRAQPSDRVIIQTPDAYEGLFAVFSTLLAGKTAVLDPKRSARDESPPTPLNLDQAGSSLPLAGKLEFFTSGSTGAPKAIEWRLEGLFEEVKALQHLYALRSSATIVGLVSPLHIYGFLHLALLPLTCDADCWLVDPKQLSLPASLPERVDLLVAVPALWQMSDLVMTRCHVDQYVTSAGPFGRDRAAKLEQHVRRPRRSLEIFGSTETGGIGYRDLVPYEDDLKMFPGIELGCEEDGTHVHSPYRGTGVWIEDRLQVKAGRTFRHLGRSDRVIKFSGKRLSLDAIEQSLSRALADRPVFCVFVEDDQRAQGGSIVAFVESQFDLPLSLVRGQMSSWESLPEPSRLITVERFPRDGQGKLQVKELLRLL